MEPLRIRSPSLLLLLLLARGVHAAPVESVSEVRTEAPCAILENFMGDVQILDSSRTHLIDASMRAPISCGFWVSVSKGWAQIRLQNGPHIHMSSQTFIQFPEFKTKAQDLHPGLSQDSKDHVILYRGQIFVQAGGGEEEFRMLSASGRARVNRGKVIFIFDHRENDTQLIALENSATLENRFEPSSQVKVRAGEATDLNFKLLRVVPTLPQAVSVASLRPRLAQLHLLETDQFDAVRAAMRRQNRTFAAKLMNDSETLDGHGKSGVETPEGQRKPASLGKTNRYLRHQPNKSDAMLHAHWVKKMAGGEQVGERILYPDKFYGRSQKVHVDVEDPAERADPKVKTQLSMKSEMKPDKKEEAEKKKLMDELSQIRVE